MVPPIRWHHLFSSWIFLLSVAYPIHQISTFPLNIIAIPGTFVTIINPHKEHWVKSVYIVAIHILPFLWIPFILSYKTIGFAVACTILYLIYMMAIDRSPIEVYTNLMKENHKELKDFMEARFG